MSHMIWRLVLFLGFCSVVLNTIQTPFGADLREPFSLSYDPLSVTSFKPSPDKVTGYKEMKKLISTRNWPGMTKNQKSRIV